MTVSSLDSRSINTIRFLSVDAIQKANSGHPGLPMGAATMAYTLWQRYLKHNPADPKWPDRDRFILSAGHGSMLLYSLLHLTGYPLSLEEVKGFRQWGTLTPGHPESHLTPGVETTTGPLGQGISNAVGMAIAEAHLAARYNRPGFDIVDHYTYVLIGDGDLMEGVSFEACSLAGHLGLGKLIALYDDNRICLSGSTVLSFSENVLDRFQAIGWHVQEVKNGEDLAEIGKAIEQAQKETGRPSLIKVRTTIGHGSPHKQGTSEAHGSPLGADEVKATKAALGWPTEPDFLIPDDVAAHMRSALVRGGEAEEKWNKRLQEYAVAYPVECREFQRIQSGVLPEGWDKDFPQYAADAKGVATRKASETMLQLLASRIPELMGGAADLNPSTFTWMKNQGDFQSTEAPAEGIQGAVGGPWGYIGRNIHFGVREHAMGSIVNGLLLHGGFRSFGSTFLVFADYMRPAVRLSAIMKIPAIWVFTHDGIGVGEDGPTHQAVEHYAALRAIPNLLFLRPCDANETVYAWKTALENNSRPTVLALTRQNVPTMDRTKYASAAGLLRGAYLLNPLPAGQLPDMILIASGSEVSVILAAEALLAQKSYRVSLVSMPSWELFREQSQEYRDSVLPPGVKTRIAVETGISQGWHEWVGEQGGVQALDGYGASAPGPLLMKKFGFTPENVAARAEELFKKN